MSVYPDSMSLREARTLFFEQSNLGPDGGYGARWVRVEAKPVAFYFPNSRARVASARLHDLHHIAVEYKTDWPGEIEIAGWEIGSGCGRFHAAWILNFAAWTVGLVLAPRRLFRAFIRGRRARTNLYHSGLLPEGLEQITVGELRTGLGLRSPSAETGPADVTSFAGWSAAAVGLWVGLPVGVGLAALSLICRQRHGGDAA